MSRKLARLPTAANKAEAERRQSPRYSALTAATLVSSRGETAQVSMVDVSTHGCCVSCDAGWLRTGAFVAIGLDENPMLQAIVRWVRDDSAGMEFLRPIPPERSEWYALLESPFGS